MFESVFGVPTHPLVVHLPVVVLPLAAIGIIVLALKPTWRSKGALPALVAIGVGAFSALAAVLTGNALAEQVGLPVRHQTLGIATTVTAFLLTALAGAWLLWERRSRERTVVQHGMAGGSAVLAAAVLVLTVLTGHAGASSAWSHVGEGATPPPASSESPGPAGDRYSMDDVKSHDTVGDCWAAVDGKVYDLTEWVSQHPGGPDRIAALCGTDATSAFRAQHGSNETAQSTIKRFEIGTLE